VKQNKGFIWVYSEPGRGSTFKIYLPLETSLLPAESTGVDTPEDLRGTETILLVEDYAGLRGAARHLLLRQGYTVLECTDGESALDLIARTEPRIDLLLTDVVMPVMSGRELAERFRMRFPGAKILYMSGYPDQAIVSHGILNPGVAYLQKPFSSTSLSQKVRQVLDSA
jgi:CheY-like chemotaxis protein